MKKINFFRTSNEDFSAILVASVLCKEDIVKQLNAIYVSTIGELYPIEEREAMLYTSYDQVDLSKNLAVYEEHVEDSEIVGSGRQFPIKKIIR